MANYKLLIKPSAAAELEAVPKHMRGRIAQRIQNLAVTPRPSGSQKLTGEEKYRLRQGSYRIVCAVSDLERTVLIVKIGHRREVYR